MLKTTLPWTPSKRLSLAHLKWFSLGLVPRVNTSGSKRMLIFKVLAMYCLVFVLSVCLLKVPFKSISHF